jgi:protein-disulfide isomerase
MELNKLKEFLTAPVAILIGAVIIAGSILYVGSGQTASIAGAQNTPEPSASPTKIADPSKLFGGEDAVLGNANAKVTIVEFSDFQCPYCRKFFVDTYQQLKKTYIDTGKVKLIFRHFPLSFHDAAKPAALATACAKDQGKFWEMHDTLFAQQQKQEAGPTVVTKTVTFSVSDIKSWAKDIGLDMPKFNSCFDSNKYGAKIDADSAAGQSFGVEGTPSFFINGKILVGAQPFSEFKSLIDAELKR